MGSESSRLTSVRRICEGLSVRFTAGALEGLCGVVVEEHTADVGNPKYVVSLNMLGERISLNVDGRMLEAIGHQD